MLKSGGNKKLLENVVRDKIKELGFQICETRGGGISPVGFDVRKGNFEGTFYCFAFRREEELLILAGRHQYKMPIAEFLTEVDSINLHPEAFKIDYKIY